MGWTTGNSEHLIRSEVWSRELKEIILDNLQGMRYVRWLSDFPDGDQLTIPSIGQSTVRDYTENTSIKYDAMDTGEFTFNITEYLSSGTYITDKDKQDMYYAAQLISSFIPKQRRALDERVETDIFRTGQPDAAQGGQTANDPNTINGAYHRYVASGTNDTLRLEDFARAKYALNKANVPLSSLIAVVDPSGAYELETLTNIVNVSNNPQWEGIITSGITTGMRFIKNVYGFDVWESNYLPTGYGETIDEVTITNGVANQFFSIQDDMLLPFVGAWRQMPNVESERNKDFQRDEYVVTARYGLKLFRPENFVTVLSATDQVYA
jgi:hypothetical protein